MLISHPKKFIYLKTTKTAGTSVEIFFQKYCLPPTNRCHSFPTHYMQETISEHGIVGYRGLNMPANTKFYNHIPANSLKNLIEDNIWKTYCKFCVVRNPYDKVVSWWWFQLSEQIREQLYYADFSIIKKYFKNWILSTISYPIDNTIYKINNEICVDIFLRFENLSSDVEALSKKLKIPFTPSDLKQYKNQTRLNKTHFSEYYDKKSIKIIYDHFAWEIDYFGYSKQNLLMNYI